MTRFDFSRRRSASWWLITFFAVLVLLAQLHGPRGGADDDAQYMAVLQQSTLFAWAGERYASWSGRVLIDSVTVVLLHHAWLWRLCNAFLLTLLVWLVAQYIDRRADADAMRFLVIGFFLLDAEVVRQGVWWMTGSFNYLWPLALGALAGLPFARPAVSRMLFAVTVPAAAYAASQEQAGVLLLLLQGMLAWHLWRCGQWARLHALHALQVAVTVTAFTVVALSPGSARRFQAHLEQFPEYGALGILERLFSGLQLAFGHAFGTGHVLGLLFCALLLATVIAVRQDGVSRFIAAVPVAVTLLPFTLHHAAVVDGLLRFSAGQDGSTWRNYWIGSVSNVADAGLYTLFMLQFIAAACVAISLWAVFQRAGPPRSGSTFAVLVWGAGLGVTALVGFSPSLYLSGQRIFLFQDMLVLSLAAALYVRLNGDAVHKFLVWVTGPLALIGLLAAS